MVIAEKATERWGSVMKHITTACVIMTLYGSCVVVLVLMGDFLANISHYFGLDWRYRTQGTFLPTNVEVSVEVLFDMVKVDNTLTLKQ